MVVGVLQIELILGDARSLKDKRRVISSLKERLHRSCGIAVAEVDQQDAHKVAVLGLATVANDAGHAQSVLDSVIARLRSDRRVVLGDFQTEILAGQTGE